MKRISRSKQLRIDEKRYNDNLFNNLSNLSKEDQAVMRAELLINPIQLTYSNGRDSYIRSIVDFKRNGKIIILDNGNEFIYKQKSNQDYAKYQAKSGEFGSIYFSFLENKRNLEC